MPAWFAHPGILIVNRLGKKKRFDGMCLVIGSLVPDLEFIPQILFTIFYTGSFEGVFRIHAQGLFHSLLGMIVTVPLTIIVARILRKPAMNFLFRSGIADLFKFRTNDPNVAPYCWSLKNSIYSAVVGVSSAIFFDFISHDSTKVIYPVLPAVKNPLLIFKISSFSIWILLSIILLVLFFISLYKYPLNKKKAKCI